MRIKKIAVARLALPIVLASVVTKPEVVAQSGPAILTSPVETPGQFSYGFADPRRRVTDSGSRSTFIATLTAPTWLVSTCSCSSMFPTRCPAH